VLRGHDASEGVWEALQDERHGVRLRGPCARVADPAPHLRVRGARPYGAPGSDREEGATHHRFFEVERGQSIPVARARAVSAVSEELQREGLHRVVEMVPDGRVKGREPQYAFMCGMR
jgi:hypothetical protein